MKRGEPLAEAICFVPRALLFEYEGEESLSVMEEPKDGAKVSEKLSTKEFTCAGLPLFNAQGGWMRMTSPHKGWVLLQPQKKALKGKLKLLGAGKKEESGPTDWLKAVEQSSSLQILQPPPLSNFDKEEMQRLQTPPPGWSLEADEELGQFIVQTVNSADLTSAGVQGSEYFQRVEVSSEDDGITQMLDSNLDNYWESDGNQGQHWLRFHMKPGVVIEKFALLIDSDDGSYLPRRVVVKAGSSGDMSILHTRNFGMTDYESKELNLFPYPLEVFKEVIEVHVKSCYQGGIDTRIRGVAVTARTSKSLFLDSESLSEDIFSPEKIARYPKLQPFQPKQLFFRGLVLKRLAYLLDEDLNYLLPRCSLLSNSAAIDAVSAIRQLWPLSQKRNAIIQQILSDTTTSSPSRPVFYINRMAAAQHKDDPSQDPECKKTVFCQLLREMKKHTKPSNYNFRWAGHWSQWWECKFMQEGIIDQGGGFRDTISDISEELCPGDPDSAVALPLLVRSPNQSQDSSNVYRDAYVPNPGCKQFARYVFMGQLMGACFRSQENLILSLPQFIWKKLIGEPVTWPRDFISVDSAEVKLIDSIETMNQEKFNASFAGALNYTMVVSNGEEVPLVSDSEKLVTYEDRFEYCRLVKEKRMEENKAQIDAIRQGLTQVVPSEVLNLLTWQELELKVCGNPDVSVEALKKSSRYESGLSETSSEVKTMWEALEKFSNDDRSRFLRFITGRRRLPCTIYIDSAEQDSKLPTSATCSNTLYLPRYSSVEEAVDRLRYAAYNCVAIDTDMTPWE